MTLPNTGDAAGQAPTGTTARDRAPPVTVPMLTQRRCLAACDLFPQTDAHRHLPPTTAVAGAVVDTTPTRGGWAGGNGDATPYATQPPCYPPYPFVGDDGYSGVLGLQRCYNVANGELHRPPPQPPTQPALPPPPH